MQKSSQSGVAAPGAVLVFHPPYLFTFVVQHPQELLHGQAEFIL